MTKTVTRIAIPAHIYIAVEHDDTMSDDQIIAEAKCRIAEVEKRREYLSLTGFEHKEHVLVYPNDDLPAEIEDRNW